MGFEGEILTIGSSRVGWAGWASRSKKLDELLRKRNITRGVPNDEGVLLVQSDLPQCKRCSQDIKQSGRSLGVGRRNRPVDHGFQFASHLQRIRDNANGVFVDRLDEVPRLPREQIQRVQNVDVVQVEGNLRLLPDRRVLGEFESGQIGESREGSSWRFIEANRRSAS